MSGEGTLEAAPLPLPLDVKTALADDDPFGADGLGFVEIAPFANPDGERGTAPLKQSKSERDADITPVGEVQGVAVGELRIPTVDLSFHFGAGTSA